MSHPAPTLRSRSALLAGSLALSLSLIAAPAAMAQDDGPDAVVSAFLTTLEAKDLEALPAYFCDEYKAQASGYLAAISSLLPPGSDPSVLLDALLIDASVSTLETVSQSEADATVRLAGTLSYSFDVEVALPFLESIASSMGLDVDPAVLEATAPVLLAEFAPAPTQIDREIRLVPGPTSSWLICDQLGDVVAPSAEASMVPAASPEASPAA